MCTCYAIDSSFFFQFFSLTQLCVSWYTKCLLAKLKPLRHSSVIRPDRNRSLFPRFNKLLLRRTGIHFLKILTHDRASQRGWWLGDHISHIDSTRPFVRYLTKSINFDPVRKSLTSGHAFTHQSYDGSVQWSHPQQRTESARALFRFRVYKVKSDFIHVVETYGARIFWLFKIVDLYDEEVCNTSDDGGFSKLHDLNEELSFLFLTISSVHNSCGSTLSISFISVISVHFYGSICSW